MRRRCLVAFAATAACLAMTAPAANAAERVPVSGSWQSLVSCAFTSYDPLTGRMSCVGLTVWTGGLTGIARYTATGTYDLLTGSSQGTVRETFYGRDTTGRRGTIVFDERYTLDSETSTLHLDALAVGGTRDFEGVRGSMTFDGTLNAATGFGSYAGVLNLRKTAR